MGDALQRGMSEDGRFRVVTAVTTSLVREACRRHDLQGAPAIILGRAVTAGCLLATLTKDNRERVRLHIDGGGPVGRILVDAEHGGVRGCLQKHVANGTAATMALGRPSIGALVGRHGTVTITRDLGLSEQYQGSVEVASGEIDVDLERYLNRSEQLPSVLACEVRLDAHEGVLRAAGILVQTFPGAPPESLHPVRARVHGGGLHDILAQERGLHELAGFCLGGAAVSSSEPLPLCFRCSCGPERARSVLSALGADDLEQLATEPGATEVRCSFCGATYDIAPPQLLALARELRARRS